MHYRNWEFELEVPPETMDMFKKHKRPIEIESNVVAPNTGVTIKCSDGRVDYGVYDPDILAVRPINGYDQDGKFAPNKDLALFIDHVNNPNIQVVVADGLPGTGKTSTILRWVCSNLDISDTIKPYQDLRIFKPDGSRVSNFEVGTIKKVFIMKPDAIIGKGHGFLPGDLIEKLTPLFGSFIQYFDRYHPLGFHKLLESRVIEMLPITYIQGLDLTDCVVIVDEFQNADEEHAIMFLTRITDDAKVFIMGDTTKFQVLNNKNTTERNGLEIVKRYLMGERYFAYVEMKEIRHVLRGKIVRKVVKTWLDQLKYDSTGGEVDEEGNRSVS